MLFAAVFGIGAIGPSALASLVIDQTELRYEIDFDSSVADVLNGPFAGAGLDADPSPGQLDADTWSFSGFSSDTDLARGKSNGGVTTGGLYAFVTSDPSASEDVMMGFQPTGSDFSPGSVTMSILNQTGSSISDWMIDYDIFYLNNGDRSSSLDFSFAVGGGAFVPVPSLDFETPADQASGAAWLFAERQTEIKANVVNGGTLFLRWTSDDISGGGSRDEFGLDNIGVLGQQAAAVPEPAWAGTVAIVVGVVLGFRRRRASGDRTN